jgi:hypothetical protein
MGHIYYRDGSKAAVPRKHCNSSRFTEVSNSSDCRYEAKNFILEAGTESVGPGDKTT